ncbi:MAG: GIY-YIG nuclease family protein [Clostridia bacterium]|nr:GIY-YIG nuclease family protein [Clostridia bacterium]
MYYIYILTNFTDKVMYIGMTNNLMRRLYEHKNACVEGFTKKYHVHKLVYYEAYKTPLEAIKREKQLKTWSRNKKDALVKNTNPAFHDLANELFPDMFNNISPQDSSTSSE